MKFSSAATSPSRAAVGLGATIMLCGANMVSLNTIILVSNSLLMPVTLAFLWLLASGSSLPPDVRIKGFHKWAALVVFAFTSVVAIGSAIWSWTSHGGGHHLVSTAWGHEHHGHNDSRSRGAAAAELFAREYYDSDSNGVPIF